LTRKQHTYSRDLTSCISESIFRGTTQTSKLLRHWVGHQPYTEVSKAAYPKQKCSFQLEGAILSSIPFSKVVSHSLGQLFVFHPCLTFYKIMMTDKQSRYVDILWLAQVLLLSLSASLRQFLP